jgi:hypothetical protein
VTGTLVPLSFDDLDHCPPLFSIVVSAPEQIRILPDAFHHQTLHGFQIRVSRELLSTSPRQAEEVLRLVDQQLADVRTRVPSAVWAHLQSVPITIASMRMTAPAAYDWREEDSPFEGLLGPERGIMIGNLYEYVRVSRDQEQPMALLHELGHAYHHRFLGGDDYQPIRKAYDLAMRQGLYDRVKRRNAPDQPAYAKSDAREYFCELTEAYFGRNDFFPFTREELERHDPLGYATVEAAWSHCEDPAPSTSR